MSGMMAFEERRRRQMSVTAQVCFVNAEIKAQIESRDSLVLVNHDVREINDGRGKRGRVKGSHGAH